MKYPSMQSLFPNDVARLANVLLRYAKHQPPGFADGVMALAEACGVEQSDLTPVTEADLETILQGVEVR